MIKNKYNNINNKVIGIIGIIGIYYIRSIRYIKHIVTNEATHSGGGHYSYKFPISIILLAHTFIY